MIAGLLPVLIGPAAMPELRLIPSDNRPKIEAAQWAQDVDLLNQAITSCHPGRLRYQTEAEYQARLAALKAYLGEPRSRAQGYLAIAQFLRALKCGHSYPNFFNQAKEVKEDLFAGRNKLPFTFRWLGSKMVVTSRTAGLVPGDEVKRIDGVPVGEIQRTLMTVARADGSNDDKRRKWLELTGVDGLEAFDIYHPLFYPRTSGTIQLTLARGPLKVEAITIEDRVRMAPPEPAPNTAIWASRRVRPDTTLLEMPSWALYNTKWDWKAWLKTFFQTLDTPNLIIDIRNNEGGNSVGREVLAYLTPTQLPSMRFLTRTQYKEAPATLRPHVSTWDNTFYNWGSAARPRRDGMFDLVRFDEDQFAIQPRSPRYTGKVAVLMSATNSSATFDFLSSVKGTGLATLIGQRSGGNQRGINGGGFFFTVLPNSKIEVDVPLIGYFPATPAPTKGSHPTSRSSLQSEQSRTGPTRNLPAHSGFSTRGGSESHRGSTVSVREAGLSVVTGCGTALLLEEKGLGGRVGPQRSAWQEIGTHGGLSEALRSLPRSYHRRLSIPGSSTMGLSSSIPPGSRPWQGPNVSPRRRSRETVTWIRFHAGGHTPWLIRMPRWRCMKPGGFPELSPGVASGRPGTTAPTFGKLPKRARPADG